jgi:GDPmannose 4,6-dehydratase
MWLMLQQDIPDDYVLATGTQASIRDFTQLAFAEVGISLKWEGEGADEKAICTETGTTIVETDPRYYRPSEVDTLVGNASKAEKILGWKASTTWQELCIEMVTSDLVEIN